MTEEVKKDLRAIPKIEGDPALSALLTTDEKEAYFNSVTTASMHRRETALSTGAVVLR